MEETTKVPAPIEAATAPAEAKEEPKKPVTVEDWAAERKTPAWLFASARAFHRWPVGQEIEGPEYDNAVAMAAGLKVK